jgi:nucleoside-diphosphate-sugar epimerase
MGELSNDPLGDLIGDVTYDVNHKGSVRLATLAKQAGVTRFVYMSSCSVYGVADGVVDETSPINPQTAYGVCKGLVERDVTALADDRFSPTFLRNATAFGASPRMRFDIVLNNLSGLAWTTRQIAMTSDGSPWRPLVHARDIGKAIRCVVGAPRETVHAEVFNVGSDDQNYQVRDIAEKGRGGLPGLHDELRRGRCRQRSYRRLHEDLDEAARLLVRVGRRQGRAAARRSLPQHRPRSGDVRGRGHTRLKQLEHLLRTDRWTPSCSGRRREP